MKEPTTQKPAVADNSAQKISLSLRELEAARVFSSTDEYVLCGVLLEVHKDRALLVSTNGRNMGVIRIELGSPQLTPWSVIIPNTAIDSILKRSAKGGVVTLERIGDECSLAVESGGFCVSVRCKSIQGKYPNWRSVVPKSERKAVAEFALSGVFLSHFMKAQKILTSERGIDFGVDGDSAPVLISLRGVESFIGVLMPYKRENQSPVRVPSWIGPSNT